jgi:mutator protein MutT
MTRANTQPARICIAIAVVERQGSVLIGLRPGETALGGLWEFPGGKVESGETPASAAIRECLEETGLLVRVVAPLETIEHDYAHGRLRLEFFGLLGHRVMFPRRIGDAGQILTAGQCRRAVWGVSKALARRRGSLFYAPQHARLSWPPFRESARRSARRRHVPRFLFKYRR